MCSPTGAATCPARWPRSDFHDGCLTCPWHGSVFRVADGSVARGPGNRPHSLFYSTRITGDTLWVRLPGAG